MLKLREVFKPVHRHPQKFWYEWTPSASERFDNVNRPLESWEEGIWRHIKIDAATVTKNGLTINAASDGLLKVEVN